MKISFHSERLKKARLQKNLTQEALAERCDSSERYIRDLENGRKAHPSAEMLYRIASTLEIPMESLVDIEEKETTE